MEGAGFAEDRTWDIGYWGGGDEDSDDDEDLTPQFH